MPTWTVSICKTPGCYNGGDKKFNMCKWHRTIDLLDNKIKKNWHERNLCHHGYNDRSALVDTSKVWNPCKLVFAFSINEQIKKQRKHFGGIYPLEPSWDDFFDNKRRGLQKCYPSMLGFCDTCNGYSGGELWKY
ncbi:hypothetical protein [Emiliania huxleyi virus 99B1]|nr:hypothetical protein [Emiliania huxleyi virus 99B1]